MRLLYECARNLEQGRLADLYTSKGKGRWVLNPRVPGQNPGMVVIWHDNGAYLSPYRTVMQQLAPMALAALDAEAPGEIGQGNYIKADYDQHLLRLLHDAYVEANSGTG